MFRFLTKTLLLTTAWFVFTAVNGATVFTQCEGVYSKTVTRKIFEQKVILITERDDYFKDLTGDGKPDLIGFVGNDINSPSAKIYILPTDGAANFGTPIQTTSCINVWNSQLKPAQTGRVIVGTGPNNLRSEPNAASEAFEQIPEGQTFTTLYGPLCDPQSFVAFWLVNYNGMVGWTAEGEGNTYWLEPVGGS